MEQITAWATGLCLCSLVCAIVEIMIPDGSTEKLVRFVMGLFMICAVATPLCSLSLDFEDWAVVAPYEENSMLVSELQNQSICLIDNVLTEQVNAVVARFDTIPIETKIHTDIDDSQCISIVSITVVLQNNAAEKALQIQNAVKNELGLDCDTVIAEKSSS